MNWGIIGLGNISHKFVEDLLLVEGETLFGVASRNLQKAEVFKSKYDSVKAYGSYIELFEDDKIDIVYIATPHTSHSELTIQALERGKHVLCEKPVALNKKQAEKMVLASKANKRFFMEGLWSRFNPTIRQVLDDIEKAKIGEVKYINADFSFRVDNKPGSRMYDMSLGGGSLLDMGVYPVFLAYSILGKPSDIQAKSIFHESGADHQTSMIFSYPNAQALLYSSFASQSNMIATISGSEGRININSVWHETNSYSFFENYQQEGETYTIPPTGNGFYHEIVECQNCISEGKLESGLWSHSDSLNLIEIVDQVRKKIGLKYQDE